MNKRGSFIYKYGPFKCFFNRRRSGGSCLAIKGGSSSERSSLKPTLKTIPDQQVDLCTGPTSGALVCILSWLHLRFFGPLQSVSVGRRSVGCSPAHLSACVCASVPASLKEKKTALTAPVRPTTLWFLVRSH